MRTKWQVCFDGEGTDTKVDFTLHNDCNERQDLRCKNAT